MPLTPELQKQINDAFSSAIEVAGPENFPNTHENCQAVYALLTKDGTPQTAWVFPELFAAAILRCKAAGSLTFPKPPKTQQEIDAERERRDRAAGKQHKADPPKKSLAQQVLDIKTQQEEETTARAEALKTKQISEDTVDTKNLTLERDYEQMTREEKILYRSLNLKSMHAWLKLRQEYKFLHPVQVVE
jgi:hypothetical protein